MIVLRRQLYSLVEEERYYGLIPDTLKNIYKSGKAKIKSKYNKGIDKGIDFITNLESKNADDINELIPIKDKKLGIKLAKEANKRGIRVFDKNNAYKALGDLSGNFGNVEKEIKDSGSLIDLGDEFARKTGDSMEGETRLTRYVLPKEEIRNTKKVAGELKKGKRLINLRGNYDESNPVLSHEIGHLINKTGTNREKKISELSEEYRGYNPNKEDRKILGSKKLKLIKELGKKAIIISKEERNAWKNGIDLMKKSGATKEEIKLAKKRGKLGVKSYDLGNSKEILKQLKIKEK